MERYTLHTESIDWDSGSRSLNENFSRNRMLEEMSGAWCQPEGKLVSKLFYTVLTPDQTPLWKNLEATQ